MTTVRWMARVLGLLLVGVFVIFLIGNGFNPVHLKGAEIAQSVVLLVALGGMLVLWRWELLGGAMVLAGMAAFYLINFAVAGRFPGHVVFPLCFVPGLLALISGWSHRARQTVSHRLGQTQT